MQGSIGCVIRWVATVSVWSTLFLRLWSFVHTCMSAAFQDISRDEDSAT